VDASESLPPVSLVALPISFSPSLSRFRDPTVTTDPPRPSSPPRTDSLWSRLTGRAGASAAIVPAADRPAAERCVILEEGASSPSGDYLLMPWLARLGLPVVRADVRRAPREGELRRGDLVVVCRYVPPSWRRPLEKRRPQLAGLVYFMDDDLLDAAAHATLAAPYAKKLATLAASQRRWLESTVDAWWVSTAALAAKYERLQPTVIPLAPPPALLDMRAAVRIVYHGTASHAAEIAWLHDVIAGVQERCPHTHFALFGDHAVNRRWRDLPRVAILHPMRWDSYLAFTASQPADIGLAPLLPGAFNAARGAVKFYDYARMGAAGVYTDTAPYRGFVRDGVDGLLLPNEPARWIDTIAELAAANGDLLARLKEGVRARVRLAAGG